VLPVRIDIPLEGMVHQFKRALVPQGKVLQLSLYTYNSRLRPLTKWILFGLGVLIGFSIGRLVWLRLVGGGVATGPLAAAAGGVAFLLILALAFQPTLAPAYGGILIGVIATLLPPLIARRVEGRRPPKVEVEAELEHEGA
jgi:hypothetical protein